jgi:hypothetical protein
MIPTLDASFKLFLMIPTPKVGGNKGFDDNVVVIPVIL